MLNSNVVIFLFLFNICFFEVYLKHSTQHVAFIINTKKKKQKENKRNHIKIMDEYDDQDDVDVTGYDNQGASDDVMATSFTSPDTGTSATEMNGGVPPNAIYSPPSVPTHEIVKFKRTRLDTTTGVSKIDSTTSQYSLEFRLPPTAVTNLQMSNLVFKINIDEGASPAYVKNHATKLVSSGVYGAEMYGGFSNVFEQLIIMIGGKVVANITDFDLHTCFNRMNARFETQAYVTSFLDMSFNNWSPFVDKSIINLKDPSGLFLQESVINATIVGGKRYNNAENWVTASLNLRDYAGMIQQAPGTKTFYQVSPSLTPYIAEVVIPITTLGPGILDALPIYPSASAGELTFKLYLKNANGSKDQVFAPRMLRRYTAVNHLLSTGYVTKDAPHEHLAGRVAFDLIDVGPNVNYTITNPHMDLFHMFLPETFISVMDAQLAQGKLVPYYKYTTFSRIVQWPGGDLKQNIRLQLDNQVVHSVIMVAQPNYKVNKTAGATHTAALTGCPFPSKQMFPLTSSYQWFVNLEAVDPLPTEAGPEAYYETKKTLGELHIPACIGDELSRSKFINDISDIAFSAIGTIIPQATTFLRPLNIKTHPLELQYIPANHENYISGDTQTSNTVKLIVVTKELMMLTPTTPEIST